MGKLKIFNLNSKKSKEKLGHIEFYSFLTVLTGGLFYISIKKEKFSETTRFISCGLVTHLLVDFITYFGDKINTKVKVESFRPAKVKGFLANLMFKGKFLYDQKTKRRRQYKLTLLKNYRNSYRGIQSAFVYLTFNSIFFYACYKNLKNFLSEKLHIHGFFNFATSAAISQFIAMSFSFPLENLKTRMQVSNFTYGTIFGYYKNLVNYIKLVHEQRIDVVLVINSKLDFNGDMKFHEFQDYSVFGLEETNQDSVYDEYREIPRDKTIITCNRGWDVGPLLIGLKYCEDRYKYIHHIHSKSNYYWNDILTSIKHHNIEKLGVDTIVSKLFYPRIDEDDINIKTLDKYSKLFPRITSTWRYNGGKMFITKYVFFKSLVTNFEEIYSLLTDKYKDDVFWQEQMNDVEIFDEYYTHYKTDIFNKPIDKDAREMCILLGAKNYFDLYEKGHRGIPDFQIEHAIERYIGYLICHNKDIYFARIA